MITSFLYIALAVLAIGFLIFIHELGHYFMARHVGMKVDAFGIGFGKPIFSWVRDGVKWNLNWLPFGGYVKIAGMEREGDVDPEKNPHGFFGKKPIDRIKVAIMGPLVNILFALLAFTALWAMGGRHKNFGEFSSHIGWVDPKSQLYAYGVRPGDVITQYGEHPFQGIKDHLYAPMTAGPTMQVQGYKVDYETKERTPFDYTVNPYPHPTAVDEEILTTGILNPASYILYASQPTENLPEGSSMKGSGIEPGDRILWVDGEIIHSPKQLDHLINDNKALVTIQRGDKRLLKRVPRIAVQELRMDSHVRDELIDWQFEAQLSSTRLGNLLAIPYDLTPDAMVVSRLKFIDADKNNEIFPQQLENTVDAPLQPNDRIIAIDGTPVKYAYQILTQLQNHSVHIIVERNPSLLKEESWTEADSHYDQDIDWAGIQQIASTIGTAEPLRNANALHLLNPVTPKMRSAFVLAPDKQAAYNAELLQQKRAIEGIDNPEKRAQAFAILEKQEKQLLLGLPLQDHKVDYNPSPFTLFQNVLAEIWQTLSALVSGYLSPKWLAGPVGMVQMVQHTWSISIQEVLFWIGAISLNLGIFNLLPVPVLDGGYILMSLFEILTGRRLKPKTVEKMIMPFAILLIGLLIFLTYHDLIRLFGNII
jgi:regulator of sigma E protease